MKLLITGDTVSIECFTSIGASSNGAHIITNTSIQYDRLTGIPYKVLHIGDWLFDSRDGCAITEPTMFGIVE